MGFEAGRMIDDLHLRTADPGASLRFCKACIGALGIGLWRDAPDHFAADELHVDAADDYVSRVRPGFQAADVEIAPEACP